jgi:hypothetical protein
MIICTIIIGIAQGGGGGALSRSVHTIGSRYATRKWHRRLPAVACRGACVWLLLSCKVASPWRFFVVYLEVPPP